MAFTTENELESYIRNLVTNEITTKYAHIYVLKNKKAVDIVICRDGEQPAIFFLETKLFKEKHGRLGIGMSEGGGFQPEIIARNPRYFETNLRWIIVDGRESKLSYLFVTTSTVRKYLSGKGIGEKYNNIRLEIFKKEKGLDEDKLIDELEKWLSH